MKSKQKTKIYMRYYFAIGAFVLGALAASCGRFTFDDMAAVCRYLVFCSFFLFVFFCSLSRSEKKQCLYAGFVLFCDFDVAEQWKIVGRWNATLT